MSFNCTTPTYESLYARWLVKPGNLLDTAKYDPKQHKRLLDLCGGSGAVALEALKRGAEKVWLLDLYPRVSDPRIVRLVGRAEELHLMQDDALDEAPQGAAWWHGPRFDFVVCRQALAYLDLAKTAAALFYAMEKDAPFVCNTFVKPKWSLKTYLFNERRFLEASGFFGRTVFHLQATPGDWDVTRFRWHSTDDIVTAFMPYFELAQFVATDVTLKFVFRRR